MSVTVKPKQKTEYVVFRGATRIGGYDSAMEAHSVANATRNASVTFKTEHGLSAYLSYRR